MSASGTNPHAGVPSSGASPPPSPERVREVLDLALERPAHERLAFVAGVCGEDSRLHREVSSLLTALEVGGEMLEPPLDEQAAPIPLTGLSFGNYRVGERIGEGGMGVVYRAEDTRLGRTVAVKALPPELARDPHRRARFEHEARVLASLNHPNIAAIHGVEETARGPVLVLEFVPGETLARRLAQGRMSADEATSLAVQIGRGLEAAHAAGVVHRDLKPANIQIDPGGAVKILDFGVSKQAAGGRGETDAERTVLGSLIGTAAYMSPEQARGRVVDRRADLWAFGCVLYEMLTGRRAFEGETASDTMAAVLRGEPDWSRVPPETPAPVLRVMRRCLEKDADRRQRDAGDAALELGALDELVPRDVRGGRAWLWVAVAAGAAMIGVAIGRGWNASPPTRAASPVRFQISLPPEQSVAVTAGGAMTISRDGRCLVFAGGPGDRGRLYSRRLDSIETVELAGSDGGTEPCFSPDGRWIAFRSNDQLRRIPAAGGGAEVLVASGVGSSGIGWDERGILFFASNPWSLRRLSPDGRVELLCQFDPESVTYLHAEPLPGGEAVLMTMVARSGGTDTPRVEALRLETGERRVVIPAASGARYVSPGRLVFWQAGALRSAPFDLRTLQVTDAPVVLLKPLAGGEFMQPPRFAVSPAGVLATLPGNILYENSRLAWYEPDGTWTEVTQGGLAIDAPRVSPDGTKIALLMGRNSGDVWIHDTLRPMDQRLTMGDFHHHPVWERDGTRVIFTAQLPGVPPRLQRINVDGSNPDVLWEAPKGVWMYPTDVAPDGKLLLSLNDDRCIDLYEFDPVSRESPRRLMTAGVSRYGARLSADGKLIAYTSEESGTMEVYVHLFPSLSQKVRVSRSGGYRPVWAGDGRRLFFRYLDRVMVVDVGLDGERLTVSSPRTVADSLPDTRYDVNREGTRLILSRPMGELGRQTRIDVVTGWDSSLPSPD